MSTDLSIRIAVCAALLSIYILFMGPLLIYTAYHFYLHSDKIIIAKRNPKLTLSHSIVCIIAIMILGPIYLLYTSNLNPTLAKICRDIRLCLHPLVAYTFLWGLVIKYWLLSFTVHYFKSTQDAAWKIHINKSQADHNWFIMHKNTFGSTKYTLKIVGILIVLTIAWYWIVIALVGDHNIFNSSLLLITVFIPIVLIAITWKITPSLYDHLYYVEECRLIIIFGGIYILGHILIGFSEMLGATAYVHQILGNIIGTTGYFAVCLLQLQFSLSKLRLSEKHDLIRTVIQSPKHNAVQEASKQQDSCIVLRRVMSHGDTLNAFFDHLANEFSIECGLAYIEFCQFKRIIEQDFFPKKNCIDENEICVLSNPEIPSSFIVYGEIVDIEYHARHKSKWQPDVPNLAEYGTKSLQFDPGIVKQNLEKIQGVESVDINLNIDEYRTRAYLLYKKYVDQTSNVQINISYKQRMKVSALLSHKQKRMNIDADTLLGIWDPALYELWKYMTESCGRFMQTDIYQSLLLNENNATKSQYKMDSMNSIAE